MNYSKPESWYDNADDVWYRDAEGVIHTFIIQLKEKTDGYQAGWYFVDETYRLDGPYETLEDAETWLKDYARKLGTELGYFPSEARGVAMNANGNVDADGVVSDLKFKSFDLTRENGVSGMLRKPIGAPDVRVTIGCDIEDYQVTQFHTDDLKLEPLPMIDRNTPTFRALDIEGLQKFRDSHNFPPLCTPETFANLTPEDWSGDKFATELAEGIVKHERLVFEKLDNDAKERKEGETNA